MNRMLRRMLSVEFAVVAIILLAVVDCILRSHSCTLRRHMCVICRFERIDDECIYRQTTSIYQDTACSVWYAPHVEPSHEHVWAPAACDVRFNLYGQRLGESQPYARGRAIRKFTPEEQIRIYEHFDNPLDAKRVFVSLTDMSVIERCGDLAIMESLLAWKDAGFSGKWKSPVQLQESVGGK